MCDIFAASLLASRGSTNQYMDTGSSDQTNDEFLISSFVCFPLKEKKNFSWTNSKGPRSCQKQELAVFLAFGGHYGWVRMISVELLKILQDNLPGVLGVCGVGDLWIFKSPGGFSWWPSCPRWLMS